MEAFDEISAIIILTNNPRDKTRHSRPIYSSVDKFRALVSRTKEKHASTERFRDN